MPFPSQIHIGAYVSEIMFLKASLSPGLRPADLMSFWRSAGSMRLPDAGTVEAALIMEIASSRSLLVLADRMN